MASPAKPKFRKHHDLMPHRVREVLLVSSLYHAFILQEDGYLEERLFFQYKELSLSSAPRFVHVATAEAALEELNTRRFDLVLVVSDVPDMDILDFASAAKGSGFGVPVVVLTFDSPSAPRLQQLVGPSGIDAVFVWNGDARILLAIIKYIEDRLNVDHDIAVAGVRVILVVEHCPNHASAFLATLYPALMKQSQALFSDGLNRLQRLMRMRTRPKVLHAWTGAEARALYHRYRDRLLGVMTESGLLEVDRDGRCQYTPEAGLELARDIRADLVSLPVLLQAEDDGLRQAADELGARYVDRRSPVRRHELREFLADSMGFGDFVFRTPEGQALARAGDFAQLRKCIGRLPPESLHYHARHNHFSNWLMARSEFELAARVRGRRAEEFPTGEELRAYLLCELDALQRASSAGVISDASPREFRLDSVFQRFGSGSLGGKARGLAFLDQLITSEIPHGEVAGMPVRVPQSFVLTTEAFDGFVEKNGLGSLLDEPMADEEVTRRCLEAKLPRWVREFARALVESVDFPLAVRSSSLFEDNLRHPFAGIYGTVMLPNSAPDVDVRAQELERAIKYVMATTYFQNARAYVSNTAQRIEEEKMGVVIQQLVGQRYGDRFYPHLSGVAQSHNYYPIAPQKAEDGIVQLVLGFGRMVVEGGRVVRFCPRYPQAVTRFGSPRQVVKESQNRFYALDLDARLGNGDAPDFDANPAEFGLEAAVADRTIRAVGSVYNAQDDVIQEASWGMDSSNAWVVTFNNILLHGSVPLAEALDELLSLSSHAMGSAVEMEFAVDMGDWGKRRRRSRPQRPPTLYLLQVRPIVVQDALGDLEWRDIADEDILCTSTNALGHGRYDGVHDIVYVRPDVFDPAETKRIAREVAEINDRFVAEGRPYVLIGPGRWGSSDPWLGVPVEWGQVCGARIIVEASPEGYNVDPSQGTHFFQNMTALGIGYVTIPPGATRETRRDDSFVDWEQLEALPTAAQTEFVRHVQSPDPLTISIDGRKGVASISR